MKKKLLGMVLSTAALVTMLSAAPVAAFAAETSAYGCNHVYTEVHRGTHCDWISGDEHIIVEEIYDVCVLCGDEVDKSVTKTEEHSYTYDYNIGYWVCQCGDSFRN